MSNDREIRVTVITFNNPCALTFEGENSGRSEKTGRRKKEYFHWLSHSGRITIVFPNGHPFETDPNQTAEVHKPTDRVRVREDAALGSYKYNVTITDPSDGKTCTEDPEVIVQENGFDEELIEATKLAVSSIESLMDESFKRIQENSTKRNPDALFFPYGITSVKIGVKAGLIDFTFEVSGPNTKS